MASDKLSSCRLWYHLKPLRATLGCLLLECRATPHGDVLGKAECFPGLAPCSPCLRVELRAEHSREVHFLLH